MGETAIKIEGVSKLFQLGHHKSSSLRETMVGAVKGLIGQGEKSTKDFWALNDVSFEINKGDALGIIGRNGAGKSTLLKIISRIVHPTKGRIEINGRLASLLEVGTGFHPDLTGRENIYLNGSILGMTRKEIQKNFDSIVDFSGIENFIDTPVKRYSSGMFVRLAFAVAAHLEPEILIVDEVLAVGDADFQKKCIGKMNEVSHKGGRTIIFVSHSMATVSSLCNRAILLNQGQVIYNGGTQDAIERYMNELGNLDAETIFLDPKTAPQSDKVRLDAVRILVDEEPEANVNIDKEFALEMDFTCLQAGHNISPNFQLMDQFGGCVFSTINWEVMTLRPDPMEKAKFSEGKYRARCIVPANLLNEGSFYVNAFLLSDLSKVELQANEVIRFSAYDFSDTRKQYARSWLGMVRPRLDWQTKLIS